MYQLYQWMAFFYIYCFCGWVWETTYVSICQRKFVNRGFLHGPWIPLYGSGALVMLILALPVRDNLILTYIVGFIGPTILELVTGWAMESIFKVRYWDYSKQKFQFHGYICLKSSLFWGLMTVVMVRWVHDPVEALVLRTAPRVMIALVSAATVLFVIDFAVSTREALNLRRILVGLEKLRADMERVQSELGERLEESRAQLEETLEENRRQVEERLEAGKARLEENREENRARREENRQQVEERLQEGRVKFEESREENRARREENRQQLESMLEEGRSQRAARRGGRLDRLDEARNEAARLLDENRGRMKDLLEENHRHITERLAGGHFQVAGLMEQTRTRMNTIFEETRIRMNAQADKDREELAKDAAELHMMASLEFEQKEMEDLFDAVREQISDEMEQGVQTAQNLQKELDELESRSEVEMGQLRLAHRKLHKRHPSARAGRWEEILEGSAQREEKRASGEN